MRRHPAPQFWSHLELAGHQDLATTQRHMHLNPAALDAAIRLLETSSESRGE